MEDSALLALWDDCAALPGRSRAHRLAAFGADGDVRERALGHWQAGLATAWRRVGGGPLEAVVDCPACAAELQVTVPADVLPTTGPPAGTTAVEWRGEVVELHLPTARDVDDASGSAQRLLAACTAARPDGSQPTEAVAEALQRADPAALPALELSCPECGCGFEEVVDLAAFVWAVVQHRAHAALAQVATLAAAYGWGEAEILALPPGRRAAYERLVPS
ncbi:hypothetical protein SAMN05660350_00456 [Geodermatophilus obscurus]|uniref:Phage baseplate protein n=1 Tax=Geodermatophilus obscurus TaxID=1861 RepID=A0A1M7S366_9ACTN|nr:hypothetical protein [Geodermatophilus obscurus]SHN53067.1 hypothetical protein SAMN05660350_00456 [Geodermatophilus obscurus]